MADISLTASMRSNLLSLQQTQSLMDTTQERLSTGKKVNSAIDNPSSYYTAQSLNNRASDLSSLLDSMGQGIQTIKAADEAIKTITSFAQQAKALANSARDAAGNFDKYAITSKEIEGTVGTGKIIVDSRADMSKVDIELAAGDAAKVFTVYDAKGKGTEITLAGADVDAVRNSAITQLQAAGFNAKVNAGGNGVEISTTDGSAVSWVNSTGGTAVTSNTNAASEITFAGETNAAAVAAKINGKAGITASTDGKNLNLTSANKEFRAFGIAGDATSAATMKTLGLEGSRGAGDPTVVSTERTSYAKQFNEILGQIDQLAKDAGYKGVNLLQENDLKVIFNEDRTSSIEISGVDGSSKGLGISSAQNDWQKNSNIDGALEGIEGAIGKLRTYASDFGNNYSIVQSREDFTDNLINVLTEGADKLTLADMNEESANMLALQTRQQLAINSLSLASQAAQSVLKLF